MSRFNTTRAAAAQLTLAILVSLPACNVETLLNQTASFGPDGGDARAGAPIGSGSRGVIKVIIENNTDARAVFTFGTYDNTDEKSTPDFFQLSPQSQLSDPDSPASLEAFQNSGVVELACARVFSVGSRRLISLIADNPGAQSDLIDQPALLDGVGFAGADPSSADAADPDRGFAPGFEAFIGVDFNCESLLLVSLEFNDAGPDPFRVDLQVVPAGRP